MTTDIGPDIIFAGNKPRVDIVFVHGLRGHRRETWTKNGVFWPEDLLPKALPNARVITWGYDADVIKLMEKSGQSTISNHSDQLLQDLSMIRTNERNRPIVFIGHSLGGLVVKDALCKSYDESKEDPVRRPRVAAVKEATLGILFLGTPHRGSDKAKWGMIATRLATAIGKDNNPKVVDALCRGAETLERIQTSFSRILINLPVWSAFEDYRFPGIGKTVVDDDSATLGFPHEEKLRIPADHSGMTKFGCAEDIGYQRVLYGIKCLVEDGVEQRRNTVRPRHASNQYISTREHRFSNPKILSFGCDEFIENVLCIPGRWWTGIHNDRIGLFLKDSVELAPDLNSPPEDFRQTWKPTSSKEFRGSTETVDNDRIDSETSTRHVPTPSHIQEPANQSTPPLQLRGAGTSEHEALLIAAEEGHVDSVGRLIKKGVDINAVGGTHGHALAVAASHGRKEVVRTLLNHGAKINLAGGRHGYALHAAAAKGHLDVVKLLVACGADLQIQGGWFRFALTAAAHSGNVRTMRVLIDYGAVLNARDWENETALHGAVWGGHIEAVRFLLIRGIDTTVRGKDTGTALEMAQQSGQESIANLLSSDTHGACHDGQGKPDSPKQNVDKSQMSGHNASDEPPEDTIVAAQLDEYLLMLLVDSANVGNEDDVKIILKAGISPNRPWENRYALHEACLNGHISVAQLLLEHGADVNIKGGQFGTALHGACRNGHRFIVILLLAWGANWLVTTRTWGTPLHAAALGGHIEILGILLRLGMPIDLYYGQYGTALLAGATHDLQTCRYLHLQGANEKETTPRGLTAYDVANMHGNKDASRYFLSLGVQPSSSYLAANTQYYLEFVLY